MGRRKKNDSYFIYVMRLNDIENVICNLLYALFELNASRCLDIMTNAMDLISRNLFSHFTQLMQYNSND